MSDAECATQVAGVIASGAAPIGRLPT